jgi:hypothetical protein
MVRDNSSLLFPVLRASVFKDAGRGVLLSSLERGEETMKRRLNPVLQWA